MVVRQAIAGLGEALGMPGSRVADLKTVVTEACNNVVLHAYEDELGPLDRERRAARRTSSRSVSPTRAMAFAPGRTRARRRSGSGSP